MGVGKLLVLVAGVLVLAACAGDDADTTSETSVAASAVATTETSVAVSAATTTTGLPGSTTTTRLPGRVLTDLPYAEESPRQILDVYLPATGDGPYPTILGIDGGGFSLLSKSLYREIGPYFAEQGYAFVAINYRFTRTDSYPAQVEDSFCALAWLYANAEEYGFDPNRVVVTGGSSGGYLASMVGTVDNPDIYLEDCPNTYPSGEAVEAAVIFYGFYDFTNIDDYPASEVSFTLRSFWAKNMRIFLSSGWKKCRLSSRLMAASRPS